MIEIHIDDSALHSYLKQLQRKLGDLSEPMDAIGKGLVGMVSDRFETKTDPDGRKWEELKESTKKGYPYPGSKAAARLGKTGSGHILDRLGDMLGSLSHQHDDSSVRVGFGAVAAGPDAFPYPRVHEFGYEERKLPQRKILTSDPDTGKLADDDERYILDILQGYIDEVVNSK